MRDLRHYYLILVGATVFFGIASIVEGARLADIFANLFAGMLGSLITIFVVDEFIRRRRQAEYSGLRKQFHSDLSLLLGRIEGFWRILLYNIHKDKLVNGEGYFEDKYLELFWNTNLAASAGGVRGYQVWVELARDSGQEWRSMASSLISRHAIWLEPSLLSDLTAIERSQLDGVYLIYLDLLNSGFLNNPEQRVHPAWPWRKRIFFDAVLRLNDYLEKEGRAEPNDETVFGRSGQFIWNVGKSTSEDRSGETVAHAT